MTRRHYLVLAVVATMALITLAGCGGGGGTTGGGGDGTLRVIVTDAPIDPELVESAVVVINRVDVHRSLAAQEGDSGFVTILDPDLDDPVVLDLVQLQNGVTELLVRADLPPGVYRQVRLYFDPEAEHILTFWDAGDPPAPGVTYSTADGSLQLTSQATSGLKVHINPAITVAEGATATLILDFDLSKTFRPIPASADPPDTANRYNLGPVVRAVPSATAAGISGRVVQEEPAPANGDGPAQAGDPVTVTPLVGAMVYAMPPGEEPPGAPEDPVPSALTNENGEFLIIGLLASDPYDVVAEHPDPDYVPLRVIEVLEAGDLTAGQILDLGDIVFPAPEPEA